MLMSPRTEPIIISSGSCREAIQMTALSAPISCVNVSAIRGSNFSSSWHAMIFRHR